MAEGMQILPRIIQVSHFQCTRNPIDNPAPAGQNPNKRRTNSEYSSPSARDSQPGFPETEDLMSSPLLQLEPTNHFPFAARSTSANLLKQFSATLAGVTPASRLEIRPAPDTASSGIAQIDALTGGLPQGCLTEVCGPESSGRTSLMLVRPEDSGPQTSVRHPWGRPPVRASIWAMPLEAVSGAGRISRREAGVTPARVAENCFKRFAEVERAAKGK